MRASGLALSCLCCVGLVAAVGPVPTASAGAPPDGPAGTVIVLQRGPLPAAGTARTTATAAREAPLAASIAASGGTVLSRIGLIDAVVARVTPAQRAALARRPDVAEVVPDTRVRLASPQQPARAGAVAPTHQVYSGVCPSDPAAPEIDPEALTTMHVRPYGGRAGAAQDADGTGVRVGVIAQGIDPDSPDLVRPDGRRVIGDYTDVTGAGTAGPVGTFETDIDTESVAAQGRLIFDLNKEGYSYADPPGCTLRVVGVAPGATVDVVQAFDIGGYGSVSQIVRAVDHLVTVDHVDVLNESLGSAAYPAGALDPLRLADDAAVAAGVTVVAGSGDSGIGNTLDTPADDPAVLGIGATDQLRALEQIGYAGKQGPWSSGNIANLSSSGIAADGKTLDAVAPGFYTWVSCTVAARYPDCASQGTDPYRVELAGGTSESAPLVAGVAALVVQAYRRHHGGRSPTPAVVRQIITGTADDLGAPTSEQGAGQVDALRAVRAAAAWDATGSARSSTPTQADLVAAAGTPATTSVQIVNHGSTPVTDAVTLRAERPAGIQRFPYTYDQGGAGYQVTSFRVTVPRGTQRLALTGLVDDPQVSTFLDVYAFDPHGVYCADADPPGYTDTSYAEIDDPVPGVWTVKTYGVSAEAPAYSGPAELDARLYRSVAGGTATPAAVRLAPGTAATVHVRVPAAATEVDGTDALQITDTASHAVTTVPIAIRRTVPLLAGSGSFTGSLTGGNGRPQGALEGGDVDVDVPSGAPELQAHLAIPADPGLHVYAYLLDPDGIALDRESNVLGGVAQGSVDLAVPHPQAGRWQLAVGVDGTLPGTADRVPYSGSFTTDPPPVSQSGLPQGTQIPAGTPLRATVRVVNDTAATHIYVADARTDRISSVPLAVPSPFTLPIDFANPAPTVTVPPFSDELFVRADAADPVSVELQLGASFESENDGQWNDPVVLGSTGRSAQVLATGDPLTTGRWRVYPQPTATATASVTLHATAVTAAFAAGITSSTGNPWNGARGTPLTLAPGQAGDITVTITPNGTQNGTVSVETYDAAHMLSSVLARFPYSYRTAPSPPADGTPIHD